MIQLRDYQQKAVNEIRTSFAKGNNRIVLCSATGSGKTVIFSEITRLVYEKGKRTLIITDRKELLSQTDNKLTHFGINPFLLTANEKKIKENRVVVAMVETIKIRIRGANVAVPVFVDYRR